MFKNFSDIEFNAWLAGFFDGEGCIYLPPKGSGVEISIANTNKEVIFEIKERIKMGTITRIVYDNENWKDKYQWRIRRYIEAEQFLNAVYDFLVIKRNSADEAIARISACRDRDIKRRKRDNQIISLAKQGWTYNELATRFEMGYRNVARICQGTISSGRGGHTRPEIKEARRLRKSIQTHKKAVVQVSTSSQIVT